MITRRSALCAIAAAAACGRKKGTGFNGYAFVASEEGRTVAVVDLTGFSVTRQITVPDSPTAVIAHPELSAVYVLTPRTGAVYEIDPARFAIRRKVFAARSAVSMRLAPERDALWALCQDPPQLARISLDRFRVNAQIALPAAPIDFDLSPVGQMCAVSFGPPGSASVFSLAKRRAGQLVPLGKAAGPVRFRPDGKQLLAGNPDDRTLSILEVPSGRVVVRLPLAVQPDHFCFSPDDGQLFVTGEGMDTVVIVYPYTTEVAKTVLAGRTPGAMAVSRSRENGGHAESEHLFVANTRSGDVTILSIELQRVIATLTVGEEPGYIAVTPDDQYALVLNRRSGNMAVIRIAAIVAKRTRPAPLFTVIPVGARPVSLAVRRA